jgi:hypothetical protein
MEATRRYAHAVETITGDLFEPALGDPIERMRKNLGLEG